MVERCADPQAAATVLAQLTEAHPELPGRLREDHRLLEGIVAVAAASPHLGRLLAAEPRALAALEDLDHAGPVALGAEAAADLARSKRVELLRIAARDLTGLDPLEAVGASLAALADAVLAASIALAGDAAGGLAIIGMGKLGGQELNYASDVDVMFVGPGDPRAVLEVARQAWRVDADLRPEGRNGPLTRSLGSFCAYWDRWAQTWEFQALLKARPVAGDPALGAAFMDAANERVWGRPFGAEELRSVRAMKARAEGLVARRGLNTRELKLGKGGIRDIEFAVQLLQLVHGRDDAALRSPTTLDALAELATAGYVAAADAGALEEAYRFLRAAEHRLQLVEDQQVHALPAEAAARQRLARVMGFRDGPSDTALGRFDEELRRHRATVRSIHERLFFRPLLEAFTAHHPDRPPGGLDARAVSERLAAFGFSDAERTRQAVVELTRGFSRASRLMQQLLPLLLEWLSQSPDPDLGLLGLRTLVTAGHGRDQLVTLFRESPEAARRLCILLGTSPEVAHGFERQPDLLATIDQDDALLPRSRDELLALAQRSLAWRGGAEGRRRGLGHLLRAEWLRVAAADILEVTDLATTERSLTNLAEAVLETALGEIGPPVPFAVIAMGRFGGAELSYASDLDVLLVFDGEGPAAEAGERAAAELLRYVNGDTPATRLWTLDAGLRPEGRHGPLARSVGAYETYYRRWSQLWERQALLRGRFVAGDPDVGRRFAEVVAPYLWGTPLGPDDVREIRRMKARIERERIPAGEDPQFHLKLGRGSLSDVEWVAQLLQFQHGVRAEGTLDALRALGEQGAIRDDDLAPLIDAYRFCEATRNRLRLVRGSPGDALPTTGPLLTRLARSLATTPTDLRDEYRRRTRRARAVVERVFYGS